MNELEATPKITKTQYWLINVKNVINRALKHFLKFGRPRMIFEVRYFSAASTYIFVHCMVFIFHVT